MPKAIILTQAMCSKFSALLDDRKSKAIFFVLICLVFALVAVYVLQTGDLIQKTFAKTASETKLEKFSQARDNRAHPAPQHFSLVAAEEMIANFDFVPVEQVQYIPLIASLAAANQLASNLR